MIHYSINGYKDKLKVLFQRRGSVIPRILPFSVLCGCICLGLYWDRESLQGIFGHPYAHQIFSISVGFSLVFRGNLSYGRFWEARGLLNLMGSKWGELAAQTIAFDAHCKDENALRQGPAWRRHLVHLVSLMHALAIAQLRGDNSIQAIKSIQHNIPLSTLKTILLAVKNIEDPDPSISEKGFKLIQTIDEKLQATGDAPPIIVFGSMSPGEKEELLSTADRVYFLASIITKEICRRNKSGGLDVPAPAYARLFQLLSDGNAAFAQCCKIADTPVPFPYAQLMTLMLFVFALTTPFVIAAYVDSLPLAGTLAVFACTGFFALNEVAEEIDNPFGDDPNDLPMASLHMDFMERLHCVQDTKGSHFKFAAGAVRDEDDRAAFTSSPARASYMTKPYKVGETVAQDIRLPTKLTLEPISQGNAGNTTPNGPSQALPGFAQ